MHRKKKKVWCSTLGDASELDWTSPVQTDSSAAERGWVCWGVQTADPAAKVCIPRQHSTVPRTVAHLLQQLMYRKLLGSSRAPLCAKVLGSNWKVHRMLPRSCLKNKKTSEESCTNQPTNQPTSQPATVWETKELIRDTEIDMKQPAGCQHTYPTGMWFHRRKKKKKKRWLWRTGSVLSLWDQSAERLWFTVDLTFRPGGGGSLKESHRLISPMAVCVTPLIPTMFLN